ncbi:MULTISPECIES: aldo/keto reductase [Gordonia]|uniref:Aldo/keto reductase n=2 Tax=Gordonia TaxID=2053 RepID=A0A9X3I435_9ACTN|nr:MULTISPECIES: aldo/keto reductase [Gordonia]MCF3938007.1 aldo/keto reductase [Gordonia tangerina]MCX2963791.1 aldo/keto reductase [Gordonia aquimaris]
MSTDVPTIELSTGTLIPQLGLGVWQADDADTEHAVGYAIGEAGYRHIDTAAAYGNEAAVGRGIAGSGVDRSDVFVTTKLWNADHGRDRTHAALDASLARLGLDHVDLYLIHWPLQNRERMIETWGAMAELRDTGKALSIGVSNFEPHHLDAIIDATGVVPAVNQIELHPRLAQRELRDYCKSRGIAVEAWSPLGGSGAGWGTDSSPNTLLTDPTLTRIGERYGRSAAQVMIRWHLQNGVIAIPKSVHDKRIAQNIDVLDFELGADDLAAIAELDTGTRVGAHPDELNLGARE